VQKRAPSPIREAFTPDQAAQSLEQIARLNVQRSLLDRFPWIGRRVDRLAEAKYVSQTTSQDMLNGPRGEGLPTRTRDAGIVVQHQCLGINIARAEIEVGFNARSMPFPTCASIRTRPPPISRADWNSGAYQRCPCCCVRNGWVRTPWPSPLMRAAGR